MQKILLHLNSPRLLNNLIFAKDINGLNEPMIFLKEKMFNLGYELITSDNNNLEDCAWVIFIDTSSFNKKYGLKGLLKKKKKTRDLYQECINAGLKNKMVLFLWEGRSVCPENYNKNLHDNFSYVFTWNDDLVDNKKYFKFYLPSPKRLQNIKSIPFEEKKMLVNITANKKSSEPGELYTARRQAIEFFEKRLGDQFDLYGGKWNKPINRTERALPFLVKKYKSYRGITYNKLETLSKYKFSLCYENLIGENGYITEKIFDCFSARSVPVYLGAKNISKYVDTDTFIDRNKFGTDNQLFDFLNKIDEKKYNSYLAAIEKYLSSEKYSLFLPENFANTIINTLKIKK